MMMLMLMLMFHASSLRYAHGLVAEDAKSIVRRWNKGYNKIPRGGGEVRGVGRGE